MDKMSICEVKEVLLTTYESLKTKDQPAVKEAFETAAKSLDVVELIPEYKKNFPNSAVLDDIIETLRNMGFDMPDYKIKGVF